LSFKGFYTYYIICKDCQELFNCFIAQPISWESSNLRVLTAGEAAKQGSRGEDSTKNTFCFLDMQLKCVLAD